MSLLTEESFALFVERHGLIPLPTGNDNGGHIHALRTFHPESYEAAAAFVEPMDYVNARLTGRVGATQSTAFGQLVCDNRTWGLTEYDPELVAATRLDPDKLATLLPMNGIVGTVTSAAAAELGIAEGTPVTTGTIDSITSAIGAGALTARDASIIVGTTSVLVTHIDHYRGDLRVRLVGGAQPVGRPVLRDGRERRRRTGPRMGDAIVRLRRRLRACDRRCGVDQRSAPTGCSSHRGCWVRSRRDPTTMSAPRSSVCRCNTIGGISFAP